MNIQKIYNMMPGVDCSACFVPYCNSLTRRVLLRANDLEECPLLTSGRGRSEKLEPLRRAISEGVERLERGSIKILGTKLAINLPVQGGARPIDIIDIPRAQELVEGFLGAEHVRALPKLGILRARLEGQLFLIARDGRVLTGSGGPPGPSALSMLSKLLWGSVNLRGPIIPKHRSDGTRVRFGSLQRSH